MTDEEALLDYRRSVAALYVRVRQPGSDAAESCQRFRQERDALFRSHPQSALLSEQKAVFNGLPYYDYNPAFRFLLPVDPNVASEVLEVELEHDGLLRMRRFGTVHVPIAGQTLTLSLFWLLGYSGGWRLMARTLSPGWKRGAVSIAIVTGVPLAKILGTCSARSTRCLVASSVGPMAFPVASSSAVTRPVSTSSFSSPASQFS